MGVMIEARVEDVERLVVERRASVLEECYLLYRDRGGVLPAWRFVECLNLLSGLGLGEVSASSRQQVLSMARFAQIEVSPQEVVVYGHLRQIIEKPDTGDGESSFGQLTDVSQLSDQRLLAEILLVEERLDDRSQFVAAYPNIFGEVVNESEI